jgi:hypothetical protein
VAEQSAATCSRWFLACGFFYPEDGGDTLLRNVGSHKTYTAVFIVTAVKTSDLTKEYLIENNHYEEGVFKCETINLSTVFCYSAYRLIHVRVLQRNMFSHA